MIALPLLAAFSIGAQTPTPWPLTAAESSNFTNTSSYNEVISFLVRLAERGAPFRMQTIGTSTLGKPIPLVICHRDPNITPTEAVAKKLPVVYLQANIHAGEVEGKEAVLQLLREFAQNPKDKVLEKLVLVVQPIYNSDGNDKWGTNLQNRGHQDGPDPVGERANGQGLDLNRDCMKAESPEMNAVLQHVYRTWNPDVVMDLHTTNGTRHGYVLTYSPGLNPNSDPEVLKFTRDELLPKMRREAKKQKGWEFFDYGDASFRNDAWSFSTFASDPRYVTNYSSIRNRISILSEAASFQPFKLRVETTYWFVRNLLQELARQDRRVFQMIRNADRRVIESAGASEFGVRFDFDSRGKENVLLEVERPAAEIDRRKAPTAYRTLEMTILDRFKATKTARLPYVYFIPRAHTKTIDLLLRQGVEVDELLVPYRGVVSAFLIDKVAIAPSAFQGHRLITLDGTFQSSNKDLEAGTFVVRGGQALGLLAFHLLEPESTDGAAAWGFLGESFAASQEFPIYKGFVSLTQPMRRVLAVPMKTL